MKGGWEGVFKGGGDGIYPFFPPLCYKPPTQKKTGGVRFED